jgi:2Fe-2S ferredoxin
MAELIVTTRTGDTRSVDAPAGSTAMEAIRDAGIDELLALCGGVCSCATCHIHVDPGLAHLLPPASEDENGLLEGSAHRNDRSRLACQIRIRDELSGLRMTIAPED